MTLTELYEKIGGSYDRAISVLRIEKLIDKHIRKFPKGGVVDALIAAGDDMDPTALFESAHAMKGVCANLGLIGLAEAASELAEEYRPGNERRLTDGEVKERLERIRGLYRIACEGIGEYENSL
ncbi:MAG: Hpt domain-containing protein [Clostridia bacterium]|nr:Hpt domain-containing protein [Clostridia bacterium]